MAKPKTKTLAAVPAAKVSVLASSKISKKRRAVKSLRVSKDMRSFFEGGPLQVIDKERAAGLFSGSLSVINLETKEVIMRISHPEESISAFYFHARPDEVSVFTASANGMIRRLRLLNNWSSFEICATKKTKNFHAFQLKVDDSGRFLAAGSVSGDLKVFSTTNLDILREVRACVGMLRLRLAGPHVFVASRERKILEYDILSNKNIKVLKTQNQDTFSDFCILDQVGPKILVSGLNGALWISEGRSELVQIGQRSEGVTALEAVRTKRGVFVFLALEGGTVEYGQVAGSPPKFELLDSTLGENKYTVSGFACAAASGRVYTSTEEGTVFVQRIRAKKSSGKFAVENLESIVGLNDHITEVRFLAEDQFLVCSNSEAIRWHDLKNNKTLLLRGHEDLCTAVDTFKDQRMVSGSKDGKVFLWDITLPEEPIPEDQADPSEPPALAEPKTSAVIRKKYKAHTGNVASLSFGRRTGEVFVSAGSEGVVKLWDLARGTCKSLVVDVKEINSANLSPCERLVAVTGHDKRVFLYSTPELQAVSVIAAHERSVWEAVFSADSKKLATGSSDHKVKVFDLADPENPKEELALEGHAASVLKVRWFFNDLQLVSAGADGVIKVWNVRKGTCLFTSEKLTGRIWALDLWERDQELGSDTRSLVKILAGDNDDNLVLFEDDTHLIDSELIAAEQEQDRAIDEVKLALEKLDFADGLRKSFRANMPRQFFAAFQRWYNHCLFATPLVFNYDETTTKEVYEERTRVSQEKFAEEADAFVSEMMDEDFSRLLTLTKNNITNSRTAFFAQLLLQSIVRNLNLSRNDEYKKKLSEKGADWKQLLEIISIFVDRTQLSAEKALRQALQLDFELEAITLR